MAKAKAASKKAGTKKIFKSFQDDFSLSLKENEIILQEHFNCSSRDSVGAVLKAMDEEFSISEDLYSKHGKGIKRRKLIKDEEDDQDNRGIDFINEFINYLNSISNEDYWQILSTTDSGNEETEYLESLRGIFSDKEIDKLLEYIFNFDKCEYLFIKISYSGKE